MVQISNMFLEVYTYIAEYALLVWLKQKITPTNSLLLGVLEMAGG